MSVRKSNRKNRYKSRRATKKSDGRWRNVVMAAKAACGILLIVAMGFAFIFGYDYITQCDYFNAKRLQVEGTRRLTPDQVLHQAGIRPGVNILSVNLSLARKRLLAHPLIAEASVSLELPSAITVRIKEHVPMAVLDLGRKFVINTDGEIFKEMDESDPRNLPVITGLTFADITVGGKPRSGPFKAVMAVLQLSKTGNGILPNTKIKRIDVDREIGLTLYAMDRIKTVKVGYDDYREKFRKLGNVLLYLETRNQFSHLESIDLNNLNRIVVTPAGTESPDRDHKEV